MRKGWVEEGLPFAVVEEEKNALRIICMNNDAIKVGLVDGMSLTDARAIEPNLATMINEPLANKQFLSALHRWADKYSPWVATHKHDALLMDITGCSHLFRGEGQMMETMLEELCGLGMEARLAIADTKQAAFALSHYASNQTIAKPGETFASVSNLPVDAIDTERKILTSFKRLGLKTIHDVLALPLKSLARRFSIGLVTRLDELIGASSDPVNPAKPKPTFAARISLPDPIGLLEDVEECARRLISQICKRLHEHQMGARQLLLEVHRADNSQTQEMIGIARPCRDEGLIFRQFAKPLENLDAGYGIERMRLSVTLAEPFVPEQLTSDGSAAQSNAMDDVLSRIGNRIGFEKIGKYHLNESHLPERSFFIAPVLRKENRSSKPTHKPLRPLLQFRPEPTQVMKPGRPPKQFAWRRKHYDLVEAKGPERILPEWWHKVPGWQEGPRDYWWVQTREGERLWLYHALGNTARKGESQNWYVAGIFP